MTPALEPWWWAIEGVLIVAPFLAIYAATHRGRN